MASRQLERALILIARINGGDATRAAQAREELDAWRRAAPGHEAVFRQADAHWRAVSGAAAALHGVTPKPRKAAPRKRAKRVLQTGAALAVAFVLAFVVRWYLAQPVFQHQYTTGTAQVARAELPDGSKLELSAQTRLQVTFYRHRRAAVFERGEARFDVATDARRPFTIATRLGIVRVLGTAFIVADRGSKVVVSVERGDVAVAGLGAEIAEIQLSAGERVSIEDGRLGTIEPVAPDQIAAWRSGWLVFDDTPLSEALPVINAWRAGPIMLADQRAGRERLTGSFRTNDPEAILDMLPRILPLEVRRLPDRVEIASRR